MNMTTGEIISTTKTLEEQTPKCYKCASSDIEFYLIPKKIPGAFTDILGLCKRCLDHA